MGAWRQVGEGPAQSISVAGTPSDGWVAVASRSHLTPEDSRFLETLSLRDRISVGSSLKFCVVAEGRAHVYPRFGPTWEWDTAAGQAIVEAAGGQVLDPEGQPLRYNKPSLQHTGFVAWGYRRR